MANWINLLEVVYPVGSIYMSFKPASPSSLIGGSWEQITDMFLLPSTSSGEEGGQSTHNHAYGLRWWTYYGAPVAGQNGAKDETFLEFDNTTERTLTTSEWEHSGLNGGAIASWKTTTHPYTTHVTAETSENNALPPYITTYCWRRIS